MERTSVRSVRCCDEEGSNGCERNSSNIGKYCNAGRRKKCAVRIRSHDGRCVVGQQDRDACYTWWGHWQNTEHHVVDFRKCDRDENLVHNTVRRHVVAWEEVLPAKRDGHPETRAVSARRINVFMIIDFKIRHDFSTRTSADLLVCGYCTDTGTGDSVAVARRLVVVEGVYGSRVPRMDRCTYCLSLRTFLYVRRIYRPENYCLSAPRPLLPNGDTISPLRTVKYVLIWTRYTQENVCSTV